MATNETLYYCTSTYLCQRGGVGLTYGVQNRRWQRRMYMERPSSMQSILFVGHSFDFSK